MESRRSVPIMTFTSAIKDSQVQIAQLTELGLVELFEKDKVKIYMNYLVKNVPIAVEQDI